MIVEPRQKICLSLQTSTLRALDALAERLNPASPNRSGCADASLRYVLDNFDIIPANETEDA